jgi:hypothetical protein
MSDLLLPGCEAPASALRGASAAERGSLVLMRNPRAQAVNFLWIQA